MKKCRVKVFIISKFIHKAQILCGLMQGWNVMSMAQLVMKNFVTTHCAFEYKCSAITSAPLDLLVRNLQNRVKLEWKVCKKFENVIDWVIPHPKMEIFDGLSGWYS